MLDGASTALIEPAAVNINAVEINEPHCDGYSQASDIEDPLDPADFAEESDSPDDQDVAPSEPANVANRSEKEQQNEKNTVLRTTTSLHDDWLHRGEFLPSMSFIVCASRVHRVRKPVKVNADSPEIYFPFQPHYALLRLYCQQIRNRVRVTRLVGRSCPPCTADSQEEHAEYSLVLFGNTLCPGPGCCSDPLMFRKFAFKPQAPQTLHAFSGGWKAQKAWINL